ncbi:MAG: restriction endonuclease subunit S [Bacteroidales bacterium]|nr:restriction endonuclease subunit S [Bacteroidales bacterium]
MPTYPTYKLGEILSYEQPTNYIVESTEYDDSYPTPVLTAGKSFILGYTNETKGVYDKLPVIIFDDFTTASQFVDFKFKVKSSAMKILSCNEEIADIKYMYYLMQITHIQSDTHKRYWISDYSKVPVSLPPLPTQRAIVTRIETLFAELDKAVQHLRTAQQQLKTYRQAVLKAAFEECDSYEKITNCFDVTGGLTKNSQREKFPIKMPYLRVANVYYNRLDLSEIKEIGVQESEIEDKLLKKDDLLFVEGNGSKEQIGRVAIWNGSIENCLHQNHIIKGRPLGTMLSKFALYYFISDFGREQILKVASSTSGLYTLSTEKVRNLKVPSCSLTEQQRIVNEIESCLSQATASETYIENALQQAEALRQSILKKAFSGELV